MCARAPANSPHVEYACNMDKLLSAPLDKQKLLEAGAVTSSRVAHDILSLDRVSTSEIYEILRKRQELDELRIY